MKKRFIQIGEKYANGRFGKNEQYEIGVLIKKALNHIRLKSAYEIEVSSLDRIFNTDKYKESQSIKHLKSFNQGWETSIRDLENGIHFLIDNDNFGKKKKRR